MRKHLLVSSVRSLFSGIIIFILAALAAAQSSSEWRKLVPLVSTWEDVEKVLGRSTLTGMRAYSTDEGRFVAVFQFDTCNEMSSSGKWKVTPGTLIHLAFLPKVRKRPELYEPSLNTYKRSQEKKGFIYKSPDESVLIFTGLWTDGSESVVQISLGPSKNQQILKCA